jgi:hypothetical protein
MAKQLGRWRGQDAPVGARPGAYITPIDDLARRVAERRANPPAPTSKRPDRAEHIHIHMPPAPAKTRDAIAAVRDQRRLVCTVAQHGVSGEWSAADPDGPLERREQRSRLGDLQCGGRGRG